MGAPGSGGSTAARAASRSGIAAGGGGPEAGDGGIGPEEEERVGAQSLAEPLDRAEGEVPLAPLDAADEGPVEPEDVGELLLRQALLLPEQAHVAPEPLLQVAFHGRDRRSLLLDGLQTDQ
jgi:hypothetical protein